MTTKDQIFERLCLAKNGKELLTDRITTTPKTSLQEENTIIGVITLRYKGHF